MQSQCSYPGAPRTCEVLGGGLDLGSETGTSHPGVRALLAAGIVLKPDQLSGAGDGFDLVREASRWPAARGGPDSGDAEAGSIPTIR